MAAVTPTHVGTTSFGGRRKLVVLTMVPESASDTVTLTEATHKIGTIDSIVAVVNEGQDANLQTAHCTKSGLVITVATLNAAGSSATDWTGAVITLHVVGY